MVTNGSDTSPTDLRRCLHPSLLIVHLALALSIGIILARTPLAGLFSPVLLWWGTILLAIVATVAIIFNLAVLSWRHFLLIVVFVLAGLLSGRIAFQPVLPPNSLANHISPHKSQTIIAQLLRAPEIGPRQSHLLVKAEKLLLAPAKKDKINPPGLAAMAVSGLVRVTVVGQPTALRPGQLIFLKARFHVPRGFANPGGYNHKRKLALQHIHCTAWVSNPVQIIPLPVEEQKNSHNLWAENIRAKIINFLRDKLPPDQAGLYRALLTGDRAGISPATREAFQRLGIAHLLAISGLHMAMLGAGFYLLLIFILRRSTTLLLYLPVNKIAAIITIFPLLGYCLISGLQPSALRAFIMISIFLLAGISARQWHGLTSIALAALLILVIDPLALFDISFQLSFAAVTGIILLLPQIIPLFTFKPHRHFWQILANWFSGSLAVAIAAILATMPLVLFYFQRTSLVGVVATLLFEPLFCFWSLAWGLPATLAIFIWPDIATTFFTIGGQGLTFCQQLVLAMGRWPGLSVWVAPPDITVIVFYYLGLFLLWQGRNKFIRLGGLFLCLVLFMPWPHKLTNDQLTILDVGKGNCAVIEMASGQIIMIDGGGPHSPTFDIGRLVIAPFLRQQHIRHLDLIISSHADRDHYSGLPFILQHFSCGALWVADKDSKDPGFRTLLALATSQHIPVICPQPNAIFPQGKQNNIKLISDLHLRHGVSDNDKSLVISYKSGPFSILFPGDIGLIGEQALLPKLTHHDVVVAPHHGSAKSSSTAFINACAPRITIFSSSRYNTGMFPAESIVKRYQQAGSTLLQTGKQGALRFIIGHDNILRVLSFQPDQQQFRPFSGNLLPLLNSNNKSS